jgi:hypothetical protein
VPYLPGPERRTAGHPEAVEAARAEYVDVARWSRRKPARLRLRRDGLHAGDLAALSVALTD